MVSISKNKLIAIGLGVAFILTSLIYIGLIKNPTTHTDHIIDEYINLNAKEKLRILHAENPEKGLLIYIADQPQAKTAGEYAKQFAALSYYVAVIDNELLLSAPANTSEQCVDIAKKITAFSKQLQTHYNLDEDELPILVGSNQSSATVYAALAQAEKHTFHAAVSINLTPQLKSHSTLCKQQTFTTPQKQELELTAVKRLPTSFYIFQDQNTSADSISFAKNVGNAKLTVVDDKKQTAQAEAIQILQWLDPRLEDQISSDASDSDLPLIEVPVLEEQAKDQTVEQQSTEQKIIAKDSLAIILTGDGGWAAIDKNIAKILAAKGIPTVALDSLSYFWKARTPEETAADIEAVITQYLEKWNKKNVMLIGYSFGADVLPFVANRLTTEAQHKVSLIALLGMGQTAAFEFRLSSWMNSDTHPNRLPLLPEIAKMKWANSICIYGVDDVAANCSPTAELGVKIISMTGDHHFDEKYDELVQHIIDSEKSK